MNLVLQRWKSYEPSYSGQADRRHWLPSYTTSHGRWQLPLRQFNEKRWFDILYCIEIVQSNCVAFDMFDRESGELKQILTALTIVTNSKKWESEGIKRSSNNSCDHELPQNLSFLRKSLDMTDGKLGFRQYDHLRQLFGLKDLMMRMMMMWMRVVLVATRHVATIISHNGDGKKRSYWVHVREGLMQTKHDKT